MLSCDRALISALPDDILQKIFKLLDCDHSVRQVLRLLSGVCKRWQAFITDPKGDLLKNIYLSWQHDSLNAAACGAWLQRQLQSGAVHWPLGKTSVDDRQHQGDILSSNQSEEFVAILSCAGTNLSSLHLYSCSMVFPSRSFSCLWAVPNLTVLTLCHWNSHIKMDLFNCGIVCLRKLERFMISSNAIARADGELLGLECFPEGICMLPSLQSLQIFTQNLDQLPDSLSQLTRLTELLIRDCMIKIKYGHLPPVLATMPLLKSLVFVARHAFPLEGDDPGTTAISRWKQMTNIRNLQLSPVHVERTQNFPVEVAYLTNLQSLHLQDFDGIPEGLDLSSLGKSLTVLAFQSCVLEAFPPWMAAISPLKVLDMHLCTMRRWCLPALTGLQSLSVTSSALHEVPECFCNLTALTDLQLERCQITRISPCISKLQRLCTFNLRENQLSEVPQLGGLIALETVHLRGNRMPKRKGVKTLWGEGDSIFLPKMAVTESNLRWIMHCRYIQKVYVNVSKEERAKLDGIRQELRRAVDGRHVLDIMVAPQYMSEIL